MGSLSSGFFVDRFGRKATLLGNTVPFIGGAVIMALAPDYWIVVIGRFVTGTITNDQSLVVNHNIRSCSFLSTAV